MNKLFKKLCLSLVVIFVLSLLFPLTSIPKAEASDSDYYVVKYSEPKTSAQIADLFNISQNRVQELPEFDAFSHSRSPDGRRVSL